MSNAQRICLMGPNFSGKTTLATALRDILGPGFKLLTYSRPTAAANKMGFSSARGVPSDDQTQWEFQCMGLFEQIRAQTSLGSNYIADRSPIDFLSFTNYKMPWLMNSPQHQLYEKMAIEFTKDIDYLFFVPSFGGKIEDNGIRLMNDPRLVENEILKILAKHNIDYYHVRSTTIETRLEEVLKVLTRK